MARFIRVNKKKGCARAHMNIFWKESNPPALFSRNLYQAIFDSVKSAFGNDERQKRISDEFPSVLVPRKRGFSSEFPRNHTRSAGIWFCLYLRSFEWCSMVYKILIHGHWCY